MKIIVLAVLLFGFISKVNAQETRNIADLDFLYQAIQKMPSYKDQLKDDKNYKQLYENLRKDLNTNDDFEVFQKLAQLIYPIKDNHLAFYRKAESTYSFPYLKPEIDLNALEKKYENFSKDSIEGIYYSYDRKDKYLVYPKGKLYYWQSLISKNLIAILKPTFPNHFDVISFNVNKSAYRLFRNIIIVNGLYDGLDLRKNTAKNYAALKVGASKFEYKKLSEDIGYLRLSSFAGSNENIQKAADILNEVKSNIPVKNLIIDVRNNGGGGIITSDQFINYLSAFRGKVYILQNGNTASDGEQFIISLKGKHHIKTLGETTHGTVTYGYKHGKTINLPSNRFVFKPTDMRGADKKEALAYETIGIKPDISLDSYTEDWIAQTIKYINSQIN